MGGISVAHGENRVPSPIHESPESPQLQKRGNNNDDLPCRHHPARVNFNHIRLPLIGWGSDIRATPPWEDIESCVNPDKPGTISDFPRGSTQPRTMVRQSSIIHTGLSLSGCATRRARDTR